jgi:predicted transcriptional regulator
MTANQLKTLVIRVTPETMVTLKEIAKERGMTQSAVARYLLENGRSLFSFLESERKASKPEFVALEKKYTKQIIEELPDSYTPDMVRVLSRIMRKIADKKEVGEG